MFRFNKITLLAASLSLLNGCALLPEDGTRAKLLEMPSLKQTLNGDAQAEKIVREWPRAQWWQDFHNAELNRLIETALKDSPSLHAAAARLTQAEAVADFQAAEMLPSISASVELHHRRFSATDFYGPNGGKTFTGAYIDPVVFRYHLDLWGKDKAALEAALGKETGTGFGTGDGAADAEHRDRPQLYPPVFGRGRHRTGPRAERESRGKNAAGRAALAARIDQPGFGLCQRTAVGSGAAARNQCAQPGASIAQPAGGAGRAGAGLGQKHSC